MTLAKLTTLWRGMSSTLILQCHKKRLLHSLSEKHMLGAHSHEHIGTQSQHTVGLCFWTHVAITLLNLTANAHKARIMLACKKRGRSIPLLIHFPCKNRVRLTIESIQQKCMFCCVGLGCVSWWHAHVPNTEQQQQQIQEKKTEEFPLN